MWSWFRRKGSCKEKGWEYRETVETALVPFDWLGPKELCPWCTTTYGEAVPSFVRRRLTIGMESDRSQEGSRKIKKGKREKDKGRGELRSVEKKEMRKIDGKWGNAERGAVKQRDWIHTYTHREKEEIEPAERMVTYQTLYRQNSMCKCTEACSQYLQTVIPVHTMQHV